MTVYNNRARSLNVTAALAALLSLSACANLNALRDGMTDRFATPPAPVAANIQSAVTPPAPKWVEIAPGRMPTTDWVSNLGSAPLSALVDEALAANTNVTAARARWEASIASARAARSNLRPNVSFGGRASHTEYGNDRIGDTNSISLGPSVSWEPDLWGRIKDGAQAGDIEAEASRADFAAARLSVAGQTAQAWFDLIEAKMLLDLAEKNTQTQDRALRLTQRRFESGLVGAADVRLARSSVASAQAGAASGEQFRAASARRLETLLRRYPAADLAAATDLPPLPALEGVGAPGDIFARRPDLLAAEQRLAAQGLRIDVARKNLLPRLTLSGDGNLNANDISRLFDIDALVASLVASLTAPIYQGGALRAEVERNEALLRSQIETYAGDVLGAYLEVENALDAETQLQTRETALRVSLDEARQAEARLATRYAEGLATILQLLDAQSRAINAESSLISARKERLANRVRLHLALGGGEFGYLPPQPT